MGSGRRADVRWAFEPALRGGFNYTLLELKDLATVLVMTVAGYTV